MKCEKIHDKCKSAFALASWWDISKFASKHSPFWSDFKNWGVILGSSPVIMQYTIFWLQVPKCLRILVNLASQMRVALVQIVWWIEDRAFSLNSVLRLASFQTINWNIEWRFFPWHWICPQTVLYDLSLLLESISNVLYISPKLMGSWPADYIPHLKTWTTIGIATGIARRWIWDPFALKAEVLQSL